MAKEYFVKEEDIDVLRDDVDKKISSPNTAEVGQILSVKAIDGNGKPTEWEVVNKPGSGPGESSPYIYMTQEEYEALTEYEQDRMYWVTYPCGDWLVWQNGEAILGQGAANGAFYGKRLAIAFNPQSTTTRPNLKIVDIAKGITSIGPGGFRGNSNLTSITFPDSVTSMGEYAFGECSSLASIIFHDRFASIGKYAFNGCTSLPSIVIPDSLTEIGIGAFNDCTSIECIIFSEGSNTSPVNINQWAFKNNTSLVNVIGNRELVPIYINTEVACFKGCTSLKTVQCPINFVSKSPSKVFYECTNLESVILSEKCVAIPVDTFYRTKLKSIDIPNAVESINYTAFAYCESLMSVSIGNGIKSIDSTAFQNCNALKTITINKPKDSISYAPWGATNATVVWTG